jgi:tetratricopeptide (TPR) repeat protein
VIRTADDACSVGRAWRKRGYILIEMQQFAAARTAYEKSLKVDPGNPIARKELALIEKAMKQPGDWRTKPAPGQPAPEQLTVTTCREGKPEDK